MSGRTEICDDCGTQTKEHKFIGGQHICMYCYAERDEMARRGEGMRWEARRPGPPRQPAWAAYHLACAEVGYSLRAAPDRSTRDRIHDRWSAYLHLGAVLREEDGCEQHGQYTFYEGPEWDAARERSDMVAPDVRRMLTGGGG